MPKNRLPAIADRAVWEIVTKGRGRIRWDRVVYGETRMTKLRSRLASLCYPSESATLDDTN